MRSLLLIALMSMPVVSAVDDSGDVRHNFLSIAPISLLVGGLAANYELEFGHHGVVVEGMYVFPVLENIVRINSLIDGELTLTIPF